MNQIKYQIFLSSTYTDLIEARNKVIEIILRMHHFPVGMEMFSADDSDQWDVIKDTIASSDYYVLIIGNRYGSETKDGISYTEKEFDFALNSKVPVLAFIRQRDVATKPTERDDDHEKIIKLNIFIENATKSKMCDFWNNPDDLSAKVAVALQKIFSKHPMVGWIRSDKGYSPELTEELATLNKENRDMRDEILVLKGNVDGRKPILNVIINGKNSLKLAIPSINNDVLGVMSYPEPLIPNRIPGNLNEFISDESINAYNESLPIKEDVDIYNYQISYYNMVHKLNRDITIVVENNGKSKATEVYVEINFPEDIMVLEKSDMTDMKTPKNPMPKDIIKAAEEKYRREKILRLNPIPVWGPGIPSSNLYIMPELLRQVNINPAFWGNYPKDSWTKIEKTKIIIKIGNILHTRERIFEGYIIVPQKVGEFKATVTIICAEYENMQTLEFPIIVDQLTTG